MNRARTFVAVALAAAVLLTSGCTPTKSQRSNTTAENVGPDREPTGLGGKRITPACNDLIDNYETATDRGQRRLLQAVVDEGKSDAKDIFIVLAVGGCQL